MTDPSPNIPWYKAYTGSTPQGRLGDGREQSLLTHVRNLSPTTPSSVATAIDSFGFSNQYLMTIGPRKANLLISLITSRKPKIMLELGGYIGYSAVVLGAAVKAAGGERYISIESNEVFASIAREMVRMAGLDGNWYLREGERGVEAEEESVVGRPESEYDTECLEAFEPDGTPDIITLTKCLG
ncbi:hypothetical protein JADG_001048 [Aureobasidium aubasidani]|nr:hypothetical protein JADG_001048 [Aureobasidium pullulans]